VRYTRPESLAGPPGRDSPLMETDITLAWDANGLTVSACDQDDPDGPTFTGHS